MAREVARRAPALPGAHLCSLSIGQASATWKLSQWVHSVWLSVPQVHRQFGEGWAGGSGPSQCSPTGVGHPLAPSPLSLPCVPVGDQSCSLKDKALCASLHLPHLC